MWGLTSSTSSRDSTATSQGVPSSCVAAQGVGREWLQCQGRAAAAPCGSEEWGTDRLLLDGALLKVSPPPK